MKKITPMSDQETQQAYFTFLFKIEEPFYIKKIETNHETCETHVYVDFRKGTKFVCPVCGAEHSGVHATADKSWKTLPIHHYECHIHLRTPYIKCSKNTCGTTIFRPHWENGSTKFTVWFEDDVIKLVRAGLPVSCVEKRVGEHDTRIWRIVHRYVKAQYEKLDFSTAFSDFTIKFLKKTFPPKIFTLQALIIPTTLTRHLYAKPHIAAFF
ncbi:MAG: transposase family protein [Oscillospiraceae bacterium]|nr:transposase family protein [Oscillospiraceae bacterium]